MAVGKCSGSVPPQRPKSPPEYPDLYGKRRELAKLKMMEREICFLEEELKSVEGLQPASRSCKEVADFVIANADPLIPTRKKIRKSQRFWKWLCGMSCFNLSWTCCFYGCPSQSCCGCNTCSYGNPCANCHMPNCHCLSCCDSRCFSNSKCNWNSCCCIPKFPSCSTCCTSNCTCYPKCPKVNSCSCCCNKNSCFPCYLCC